MNFPAEIKTSGQVSTDSDRSLAHSGPMEVLNRPTTNEAQENAIRRSSSAHAPLEAMRNVQRIFNSGSYDLPTPGEVTVS